MSRWIRLQLLTSPSRTVSHNQAMACHTRTRMLQPGFSILENDVSERSCISLTVRAMYKRNDEPSFSGQALKLGIKHVVFSRTRSPRYLAFALDTGGLPDNSGQENPNGGDSSGLGGTRLGRIVSAGGKQLLEKLNSARKNVPMKIFLVLLGFYTANALATILGQTGDWDVLVAGVIVAAIEGIGMLMYKKPSSLSTKRLRSFVAMVNFWKAGVCLGLFVDAFKLGS